LSVCGTAAAPGATRCAGVAEPSAFGCELRKLMYGETGSVPGIEGLDGAGIGL